MTVLIAGLGSIGQRHARNLRAWLGDAVSLLAYRQRGAHGVITDRMTLDASEPVERRLDIQSFDRLDEALAQRPDAVLVCNPTALHLPVALAAAQAGCHVFIEKPLAGSSEGLDRLLEIVERDRVVAVVGFQMRFHPALQRLREVLGGGAIGAVVSVRAEMGEYLPDAHPYEDYRQSYAARADLGGGVLLCYSHEFDYVQWLFGPARRVRTTGGRLGSLEIDVEDTAFTELECGDRGLPVQLHHSFLQRPSSRTCEVIGERGTIRIDLLRPVFERTGADGRVQERCEFTGFQRNQMFLDEMKAFLSAVGGDRSAVPPFRDAVRIQRTILAAKQSLATGETVGVA